MKFSYIKINNPYNSPLAGYTQHQGFEFQFCFAGCCAADAIWEKTSGTNQRRNLFPDFTLVWCYILRGSSFYFGNFRWWVLIERICRFIVCVRSLWSESFVFYKTCNMIDIVRLSLMFLGVCVLDHITLIRTVDPFSEPWKSFLGFFLYCCDLFDFLGGYF